MSREIDVFDYFLLSVFRRVDFVIVAVEIDDFLGNGVVHDFVALIDKYEEQIESGHDGRGQVDVLLEAFGAIVTASDGVCRCQNGGLCIESRTNSSLR